MGRVAFKNGRGWALGIAVLVCVHIAVSILARRSFALTSFGDILQNLILLAATLVFFPTFRHASPKNRLLWPLMTMGLCLWLASQARWTYFVVALRRVG